MAEAGLGLTVCGKPGAFPLLQPAGCHSPTISQEQSEWSHVLEGSVSGC